MLINNGIEYEIAGSGDDVGIVVHSIQPDSNIDMFLNEVNDSTVNAHTIIDFSFQGNFVSIKLTKLDPIVSLFDLYEVSQ